MVSRTVLIFCAQALFIQCMSAYVCEPKVYEAEIPCARGAPLSAFNPASLAASNGGSFTITSSSPISPTGVTMKSDNAYEGPVNVGGEVPFLGAVAIIQAQYINNPGLNPGLIGNPNYPGNLAYGNAAYGNANFANGMALANAEAMSLNNLAYGNSLSNGMSMNPAFASMASYGPETGVFNGGGLMVTSSSPIAPSGVTVQSENLLVEGPLAVTGQLPFLGVVSVEGPLSATGEGAVSYGCGNGNVGIVGENSNGIPAAGIPNNGIGNIGFNGMNMPGRAFTGNGLGGF
ncbi:chorion class CB protein M5H4-like [Zerene cesonia]|uniref:chorion class CB protein M5H4-like n=1 Tax=Zerene cesonia TaxID=33412 RepID=UPI0018E55B64|nr:chorion class CB protein M5H4-like [Zerene cesonia]